MAADRVARVAILGPHHSGKTTTLLALVEALRARGARVGGVVQVAWLQEGRKAGYRAWDVGSGEVEVLAERVEGGWRFRREGWAWSADRNQAARRDADVVVVDELGLLEAQGEGHLPAVLAPVTPERARVLLLGVRDLVRRDVEARLGPFDLVLAPGAVDATDRVCALTDRGGPPVGAQQLG